MKRWYLSLVVILGCISIIGGFLYASRAEAFVFVPADFASNAGGEIDGTARNPFRGWYQINQYVLSESEFPDDSEIAESLDFGDAMAMSLLEFNLSEYADLPLGDRALSEIRQVLDAAKEQRVSVILRFSYDFIGKARETEPRERSIVEGHIAQIAPIVNEYKDIVYLVQGIFVGDYGEMHDSRFLSGVDMRALMAALDEALDDDIFLSVRTPAQWRTLTGVEELDGDDTDGIDGTKSDNPDGDGADGAVSGLAKRLGLFNDGLLASETDFGTYPEGKRMEEIAFQNVLCRRVLNGGEAINENPLNDLPRAIEDFKEMHISYLNREFDEAVLSKWERTDYQGIDGLSYIGSHLGYRYEMGSCRCEWKRQLEEEFYSFEIKFNVKNTGFSPTYKKFNVELIIEKMGDSNSQYDGDYMEKSIDTDTRNWITDSGEISVNIPADEAKKWFAKNDAVSLYLRIQDPGTGRFICFAGENDPEKGVYLGGLKTRLLPQSPF